MTIKNIITAIVAALSWAGVAHAQEPNPSSALFLDFGTSNPSDIIVFLVYALISIIGAVTLIYVIYGGFLYLTSGANSGLAEQGKKTVVHALTGLIIVILSYIIVRVIVTSLGAS